MTYYQKRVNSSDVSLEMNRLTQKGYSIFQVLPHHHYGTEYIIIYFRRETDG